MAALQVKDFPDELYEQLRLCAEMNHRSISQQTTCIIEDYLTIFDSQEYHSENYSIPNDRGPRHSTAFANPVRQIKRQANECRTQRKQALDRLWALPSFNLPEEYETVVDLVHAARSDRW